MRRRKNSDMVSKPRDLAIAGYPVKRARSVDNTNAGIVNNPRRRMNARSSSSSLRFISTLSSHVP
jgi:hypothetical protein